MVPVIEPSGRVYARPPTIDTHQISKPMGACARRLFWHCLRRRPSIRIFCAHRWSVVVHRHAPRALVPLTIAVTTVSGIPEASRPFTARRKFRYFLVAKRPDPYATRRQELSRMPRVLLPRGGSLTVRDRRRRAVGRGARRARARARRPPPRRRRGRAY